jgi:putative N6-adenine-specific DNA methylase
MAITYCYFNTCGFIPLAFVLLVFSSNVVYYPTVSFSFSFPSNVISFKIANIPRSFLTAKRKTNDDDKDNDDDTDFRSSTTSSTVKKSSYLVTCVPGLAHVLKCEIEDIRSTYFSDRLDHMDNISMSGNAAVTFEGTREASLYALCWLRSAHRVLELVASTSTTTTANNNDDNPATIFKIQTRDDIHDFVHRHVDVKDLLGDGKGGLLTLSVKAILNQHQQQLLPRDLSHSHFTALTVKNALCDAVRNLRGDRPNVDIENADVPLVCILRGEEANGSSSSSRQRGRRRNTRYGDDNDDGNETSSAAVSLSLYRSLHPPGSLHKRGYRQDTPIHKAAMKESLAAGLLLEAGWKTQVDEIINNNNGSHSPKKKLRLIDPMAGSGSLILEACMIAADIAPGLMRIRCGLDNHRMPPVTKWKSVEGEDTDTTATAVVSMWKNILLDATRRARNGMNRMQQQDPTLIQIVANDIHPACLDSMKSALSRAGFLECVELFNMDCYDLNLDFASPETLTIVTTNPPWGVRLTEDIEESWEGLKHFVRNKCPSGTRVYVLSGDKSVTATLKLKRDRMIPIQTGEQNLRWVQYSIRGSDGKEQQLQQ